MINTFPPYRILRSVARVGFVRSLIWRWRLRQILRAPAVISRPWGQHGAPCEFRIMTSGSDWMLAMWAAWSFYRWAGVDWPLAIHDGGGLSQPILTKMARLFPTARFISWEEANYEVEECLSRKGLHNLLEARRQNVMIRKLVDFSILGKAPCFISCDSDVLFFSKPYRLLELAKGNGPPFAFNRDSHTMYSIDSHHAKLWFGLTLPEKLNAGLGVLTRREVDLDFLNTAFALGKIPPDKDAFPEQTACALLVARSGRDGFLPENYSVATGTPPLNLKAIGAITRHYVGPVRYLFFDEGLKLLTKHVNNIK
jgi:hypothetical protein